MTETPNEYHVVFEYPDKTRYRVAYRNAADFQEYFTTTTESLAIPIAVGLTDEQSLSLCREVSTTSLIKHILESKSPSRERVKLVLAGPLLSRRR